MNGCKDNSKAENALRCAVPAADDQRALEQLLAAIAADQAAILRELGSLREELSSLGAVREPKGAPTFHAIRRSPSERRGEWN